MCGTYRGGESAAFSSLQPCCPEKLAVVNQTTDCLALLKPCNTVPRSQGNLDFVQLYNRMIASLTDETHSRSARRSNVALARESIGKRVPEATPGVRQES